MLEATKDWNYKSLNFQRLKLPMVEITKGQNCQKLKLLKFEILKVTEDTNWQKFKLDEISEKRYIV